MSDEDIVEKLKDRRSIDGSVSYVEMSEMVLDEAIYEIEKLRATHSNDGAIISHARAEIERLRNKIMDLEGDQHD